MAPQESSTGNRRRDGVVEVWCDGSTSGNPGPGGYAAILTAGRHCKGWDGEVSGSEPFTTNQRMEQMAAIHGLAQLKGARRCRVYSDSAYLINGMTSGKNHTRYQLGTWEGIPNSDLWQDLVELDLFHKIEWIKVKGHAGIRVQERADYLAKQARDGLTPPAPWDDEEGDPEVEEETDVDTPKAEVLDFQSAHRRVQEQRTREEQYRVLLPLIDVEGGVNTPKGRGTLISVFSTECRVLLDGEEVSQGYGPEGRSQRYAPTTTFDPLTVEPA